MILIVSLYAIQMWYGNVVDVRREPTAKHKFAWNSFVARWEIHKQRKEKELWNFENNFYFQ